MTTKMTEIGRIKGYLISYIEDRIARDDVQIAEFDRKISDEEYVYGAGGHSTQYNKARERRIRHREELVGIKRAIDNPVLLDRVYFTPYYCRGCACKVMLSSDFGRERVTCPVCEKPIFRSSMGEVMEIRRGSRMAKVQNGEYVMLDSYGRRLED